MVVPGATAEGGVVVPEIRLAGGETTEFGAFALASMGDETGGKSEAIFRALGLLAGMSFVGCGGESGVGFDLGSQPPPKTVFIERSGKLTLIGGGGGAW